MDTAFALLDDCNATAEDPRSRYYTELLTEIVSYGPDDLDVAWKEVDRHLAAGMHAVLVADYEWGAKLLSTGVGKLGSDRRSCLRVMLYRRLERLSATEVDALLARIEGTPKPGCAGVIDVESTITRAEYEKRINEVLDYVRSGETYQINFTYRLLARCFGKPVALFRRLRQRQPVPFGALIHRPGTDQGTWILSRSPELFLRNQNGVLRARPMKGTIRRGASAEEDARLAAWLAQDEKNRAENVMIVDLIRNDMGRISKIGSVSVPQLFAVETYATVHQMTSTVTSEMLDNLSFPSVLRAMFPCGSITGAPKHHTMDLIGRLESTTRGLYTGALGWIDAASDGRRCGDFCMSVAIRTLVLQPPVDGVRQAELGVGGGIVADSIPSDEYEETKVKAGFLSGLDPGFSIFETLRMDRVRGAQHLDAHLSRLGASAKELGFKFDEVACRKEVANALARLDDDAVRRLRLDLHFDGRITVETSKLADLPKLVRVLVSDLTLTLDELPLVRHKTSFRHTYDSGIRRAEAAGAFDSVFFNRKGELTEGGRSSIFVKVDGYWCTPPIESGALPGTMRSRLLARGGLFRERILTKDDLMQARDLLLCNALRGVVRAVLGGDARGRQ